MRYSIVALIFLVALAGCAGSTGVVPVGPGVWYASEMRAPALGGGAEAEHATLTEATSFCQAYGMTLVPIAMGPGPANTAYGPVSFSTTFRCEPAPPTAAAPAK